MTSEAPEQLSQALSLRIHGWVRTLPLKWLSGGVMAMHAAADPRLPPEAQREDALLWGHRDFGRVLRRDGLWPCDRPCPLAYAGRIAIDTGAWHTGILSAAWLDADGLRFLQVKNSDNLPV